MEISGVLEIRRGGEVSEYPLTQPITAIGRSADNQVVLSDELVSRHHAKLEWIQGVPQIIDLGSANGTLVNGNEIEPRVAFSLKDGDVIGIGDLTMTFRLSPPTKKAPVFAAEERTVVLTEEGLTFRFPTAPNLIVTTSRGTQEFPLTKDTLTIGRDPANDIVIENQVVSRHHAKLQLTSDGYEITDLGSTNGLTFKSARISEKLLSGGDVLWITESVSLAYKAPAAPAEVLETAAAPEKLDVKGQATVTIGRSQDNDVVLSHPAVSRKHARIVRHDPERTYVIEDLGSSNGTFVNGERVVRLKRLNPGDIIRVGPVKLVYTVEVLEKLDESQNLCVDAIHLNQFVSANVNLLQDISLGIDPNEFVAIVGGSGTGKSTLLKALNGFNPASEGSVLINGDDLYRNSDAHRAQFGYVPQEDIVHKELTVYEALDYSAQLRLPTDTTPADRHQRINEVLDTLGLAERKNLPVRKLSGGELKRVSIGVELLTKPGLFCLDEATSGLDPNIENQLMRILRNLSDQGHTVLLVTHATQNVMLCDQVAFLARGGYLAYYGPPDEALTYFEVEEFDAIYAKLETELTPKAWAERYRQSAQYQKYIKARLTEKLIAPSEAPRRPARLGPQSKYISSLAQLFILSHRNMSILLRDRMALILMLALAPIISTLYFVIWKPGLFEPAGGDAGVIISNLFMAAIVGCLLGALSSMREIVKEADIYRRERMVTLKIAPYVLSKLWIAALLAIYQSAVFLFFIRLSGDWPSASLMIPVYFTLTLAIFAGTLLGLLASAISPNQNVTPLLVLLFIVPQIIFGGILPKAALGTAGETVSNAMTTKWGFESLINISGMGKDIANCSCWQMTKEERDKLTEEDKASCNCMGVNIFSKCNFPGIRDSYHPAIDQPEPLQPVEPDEPPPPPDEPPAKPSNPPPHPGSPPPKPPTTLLLIDPIAYWQQMEMWNMGMAVWQNEMNQYAEAMKAWEGEMGEYGEEMKDWEAKMRQYQEDMETYQEEMAKYQEDMEVWQGEYQEWKENRATAIGEAEAKITGFYNKHGNAVNTNPTSNWGWMMFIMAINSGLIFGAIKWKDRR
ncbi:MAG TPA: FHA domain-containing protein [Dehalococcoidia bacterium]|nr:FHA domain-containing protein [Dehalococcoidia bacterium]